MANGTLNDNLWRTKTCATLEKQTESSKTFKPNMPLAEGQTLQNYGFPCTLWLAWYFDKLYSRHFVSYGRLH